MEPTIERKIALLGRELRDLIEQNNDRGLCDKHGRVYKYIYNHVNEWLATNYPKHNEYLREDIEELIGKILISVVREGFLIRDSDYHATVEPEEYSSSSLDEINTIECSDGAQDYGKSYRESGKFGSYPLHDDYSEEGDV